MTEEPARRTGWRQEEGTEAAVGSRARSSRVRPHRHVPPPRTHLLKVQRPHQLPSYGLRRGDHRAGRHWGRAAQPGVQRCPLPRHPSAHPPTHREQTDIGTDICSSVATWNKTSPPRGGQNSGTRGPPPLFPSLLDPDGQTQTDRQLPPRGSRPHQLSSKEAQGKLAEPGDAQEGF